MAQFCRCSVAGRAAFAAVLCVLVAATAVRAEFAENFDGVAAPALPGFWTTASFGLSWATSNQNPDSPPNSARAETQEYLSEGYLDSPSIAISQFTHIVRFRHRFQLEGDGVGSLERGNPIGYDGGVLEIAIGGADFQDIIAAGGEFLAGGYTLPISTGFGSLIGGRQAWSGDSGDYITTTIRLPASVQNSTFRLRFRLSCDQNVGGGFWTIDSINVVDECVDQDNQAPVAVCRERFVVRDECSSGLYSLGDVAGAATITDNCVGPLTLTQDPPSGTRLGDGVYSVTVTATDSAGNVGQCTSTVEVVSYFYPQNCGICCGGGMVEALLVMFSSFTGARLIRRRTRRRGAEGSACL